MKIQPIYPPMANGSFITCSNCKQQKRGGDAFVEIDKPGEHLCAGCTSLAIGGRKASEMLQEAQMRYFRATGGYCHGMEKLNHKSTSNLSSNS